MGVASRTAALLSDQEVEAFERMAQTGHFGLSAFQAHGTANMRSVGGRISTPLLPDKETRAYPGGRYPMVATPTLLPGVGGLSPLMTYGKIGSTPLCLDDDGPSFKIHEVSERERAAEVLQRGATQKLRETKVHTK